MKKGEIKLINKNKLTNEDKNLFFVSTALQLFNAIEAQHHFQTTNNILVLLSFGKQSHDERHIKLYLDQFPYDELIIFNVNDSKIYHTLVVELLDTINKYTYNYFFLGYFSANLRRLACNIPAKTLFLYDDGTYLIALHNEVYNSQSISTNSIPLIRRYSERSRKSKFKQFIFLLYDYYREFYFKLHGYKNDFKKIELSFFTIFHLDTYQKEKIVNHHFKRLQNIFQISNKISSIQEKKHIYFLGQPLDKALNIPNDTYISYIMQIASYYKEKKINFIYVPHRAEDGSIVSKLTLENFEILTPNIPFEIYIFEQDIKISHIASFFSSVLFTTKVLFPKIHVEAFKIPFDLQERNDINAIYNTLKKENIPIHNLKNHEKQ